MSALARPKTRALPPSSHFHVQYGTAGIEVFSVRVCVCVSLIWLKLARARANFASIRVHTFAGCNGNECARAHVSHRLDPICASDDQIHLEPEIAPFSLAQLSVCFFFVGWLFCT